MRYKDLIESVVDNAHDSLASKILDILTPIAANGMDYVTVDQIIDKVKTIPTGMLVDREMIMDILDPNKFPLIKSIEGDKVYLKAKETVRSVNDQQKDKEADKIKSSAAKQAIDNIKNDEL